VERNIKQGKVAKKISISQAALSAIVNNRSLLSFTVGYAICEELGVPIHEIWMQKECTQSG